MNTKYKSSILGVVSTYLSPLIVLGFLINFSHRYLKYEKLDMSIVFFILIFIIFILSLVQCIKVRYFKVNENNILIKTLNSEKIINYKDILFIKETNVDFRILSLKYKDSITGKIYSIWTIPLGPDSGKNGSIFINPKIKSKMFDYINEQMSSVNLVSN